LHKQKDGIIDRIVRELSHENFKKLFSESLTNAIISGEDFGADSLNDLIATTGLAFKKFNPFNFVGLKPGFQNKEISEENYNNFTSATGIASRFI